ncbi:MAG: glycerol-3-phosphate 1-O-acyltransferase PlsY [Acidobacteria bacterium]|nr:glycerol-3-phosphate 1-O-acyltransferase PlsY [Acidobacteriota bacterium]
MIGAFLGAFVVGSIPFGYVLVRALGKGDIRAAGSGNIGATNVGRLLGPGGWLATLLLDAAKGSAGVLIGGWLADGSLQGLAAGAAGAVLGHCYTPFLGGKGGKGVATMLGAFGYLLPVPTGAAVLAFVAVVAITRWVSLASIVAAGALVGATWWLGGPWPHLLAATTVFVVVVVRHRENIGRLMAGTESRAGGKRAH